MLQKVFLKINNKTNCTSFESKQNKGCSQMISKTLTDNRTFVINNYDKITHFTY